MIGIPSATEVAVIKNSFWRQVAYESVLEGVARDVRRELGRDVNLPLYYVEIIDGTEDMRVVLLGDPCLVSNAAP